MGKVVGQVLDVLMVAKGALEIRLETRMDTGFQRPRRDQLEAPSRCSRRALLTNQPTLGRRTPVGALNAAVGASPIPTPRHGKP